VDISDMNILYRRTIREGNINGMWYTKHKVIEISKRYEEQQKKEADIILDGNKSKEDLLLDFKEIIFEYLK
jgi:hypothetical protein